jgi:hypothetical protein
MPTVSLASYVIKIQNIDIHEPENLVDFEESGQDLLDILERYLNQLGAGLSVDDENKTALMVRQPLNRNGRVLTGLIESGDFGIATQLRNVITGQVTYNRPVDDAENVPLYFLIWIPEEGQRGILILQKLGILGIKTPLLAELKRRFETEFDSLRLVLNKLTYNRIVRNYLDNGRVTEIRLIQYEAPDDIRALYANRDEALKEVYVEYVVHAKSRKHIRIGDRIRAVLEGRRGANNLVEIAGFQPHKTKLNIEINGKRRTIDMGQTGALSLDFDISDEVEIDAQSNLPTFDSTDRIANELLEELQQQLERDE